MLANVVDGGASTLVSSFSFIRKGMLWVYGYVNYCILSVRGSTSESDVCRRQILTSNVDPSLKEYKRKNTVSIPGGRL